MCSIAGAPDESETREMLDIMKHRAPDGSNIHADNQYAIGMGSFLEPFLLS
jgi:asparagine synthetase B (glutamine-hydrolysing)